MTSISTVLSRRAAEPLETFLQQSLSAIRNHLGLDVAFIAEFQDGRRIFRHVDAKPGDTVVQVGASNPLDESYCARVVDGRLPELIPDANALPAAMELPVTAALPVGAHLSVPITLADGTIYGTFCCFGYTPDLTLNKRDIAMMRVFAQLAGTQIDDQLTTQRTHREAQLGIQTAISGYEVFPVYQPILELVSRRIVGLECLSRFRGEPRRSPDVWFQEAADVGLAIPLELHASKLGLAAFNAVPEDVYLSVNASPSLIEGGHISALGDHWPWSRVLVEITEHAVVNGYERMRTALEPLRERGAKIAVDDAGAGYASFRHILDIRPDVIKLDISLTRNIDTDRHRRALAAAMVRFSQETDIDVIAEGVETDAELAVLRDLGVTKAQGYLLGRPQPLNELVFPPAGV